MELNISTYEGFGVAKSGYWIDAAEIQVLKCPFNTGNQWGSGIIIIEVCHTSTSV